MERLSAVVTAGGTSEPVDDVRRLTNISSGRFGHALAAELADNAVATTELCPVSTLERLGEHPGVGYEHFDTAASLRARLIGRGQRPDIIFHAAAVADYRPVPFAGKLDSTAEELNLRLIRNPKIIGELRPHYGSETLLVGFKLLSGVSEAELAAAALAQLKRNRLNMVVANDLQNLHSNQHPVLAITAEGGAIPFTGERSKVARELVRFVLRRAGVTWYRSVPAETAASLPAERQAFEAALALAHRMHLLTDESGNVSVNLGNSRILVSPRQVDKSALTADGAIAATIDHEHRLVNYRGECKPSIDTGVSGLLYAAYPALESLIHFHNGWGRMASKTRFPYPCGVREEAEEIMAAHNESGSANLAVELVHHGFLLGLKGGDLERLNQQWQNVNEQFAEHLAEVNMTAWLEPSLLRPIFDGLRVAGIIYDDPSGAAVFISKNSRSSGLGAQVIRQLIQRQYNIRTIDDCQVRDYYKARGFSENFDAPSATYVLAPPKTQLEREFSVP